METVTQSLIETEVARGYDRGFSFTPLKGKKPIQRNWPNMARASRAEALRWARAGNVGLRTGVASRIAVIDIDEGAVVPDGLPDTWTVETGGGGLHLYYKIPSGARIRNSVSKIAPHIDVRGEGGQVVFVGSVHPETGAIYNWKPGHSPDDLPLAVFPVQLLDGPKPPAPPSAAKPSVPVADAAANAYVRKALENECETVSRAAEGSRNNTLNTAALKLGGLIACGLSEQEAETALLKAALGAGLAEREARATIRSGLAKGKQQPRVIPARETPGISGADPPTDRHTFSQPERLPDELPPAAPFDAMLLPEVFRPWIMDIAERMQCPPDFPAAGAVVALGSVIGRQCGLRPKQHDDWLVVPNLFGAIVGRPSVLKSPSLTDVLRPLSHLESKAKDSFEAERAQYERLKTIAKVRAKNNERAIAAALTNGTDPEQAALDPTEVAEPIRRRYVVNDSTVEKLGVVLAGNPNGVLVFRDELAGLLKSLEKEGHEPDRAFYLESWAGTGRFTYDRITRGTIDIEACCVSIFGGIQPGPLQAYLRAALNGSAGNDGFMQRFQIVVWPDPASDWRNVDRPPDTDARKRAYDAFDRLACLDTGRIGAVVEAGNLPFLRFRPGAQETFNQWRAQLEARLRAGTEHPAVEAHLAKYRSLIPSLALIFHLVDHPNDGAVGIEALQRAVAWGAYLESHARRMYGAGIESNVQPAKCLLKHVQDGDLPTPFKLRDVYRKHWTGLSTPEEAAAALDLLKDYDWLLSRPMTGEMTGGHPTELFTLNPLAGEMKA